MARFLPCAIDSVLRQGIDGLEYLVLDGASGDGTVEVLKSYDGRLRWRSERDGGAADALRRGLSECSGEILGWLNADDLLLPGAIQSAVNAFEENPDAVAVYSGALWVRETLDPIAPYPVSAEAASQLNSECLICQPACFFRASAYRECGGIDDTLSSAFDYDLWIRMARIGRFVYVPGQWALSRMYGHNKSLGARAEVFSESMSLLKKYYGYVPFRWIYSDRVFRRDGRDQFYQPLEPSMTAYLMSLPAGLIHNPRRVSRYFRDWASQLSLGGLRRRLGVWSRP